MNADSRAEDLRQLAEYARSWEDTETFLAEISLLSELSAETVSEGGEPDEKMVLSSVHQAKGLEWRAVFVVWLADGRFPSAQALKDRDGEEEERRLFYVACTRAKDELYLTYPVMAAPSDRERVVMKASPLPRGAPWRAGPHRALAARGGDGGAAPRGATGAGGGGPPRPAGDAGALRDGGTGEAGGRGRRTGGIAGGRRRGATVCTQIGPPGIEALPV